jgi:hypothetical protein
MGRSRKRRRLPISEGLFSKHGLDKQCQLHILTQFYAAMEFDQANWKFPVQNLKPKSAALCVAKSDEGDVECIGGRIDCAPIFLPDINFGYKQEREERPEIRLSFGFPFTSLEAIAGKTFMLGEDVESYGEELGSIYLFGAHNPVGWQSIKFGAANGDFMDAEVDLYFDFDYEDRIGGCFRMKMPVPFHLERRWEL